MSYMAVKYFWNKLTYVEISSNLEHWVQLTINRRESSRNCYQGVCENADVLYFLLSKMISKTEQNKVLQKNPNVISKSLYLDWPWQRFLLPTINLLWEHIDAKCFVDLLNNISEYIDEKKTTEHLFSKIWSDSPVNLKKDFTQNVLNRNTDVFCNLLVVEKVGTVKAILEYTNIEDQKKIMFSLVENYNFLKVVHSNKLHLFDDLCIDLLSQSDIKCIKEKIVCKHGNDSCFKWIESNEWENVNIFLNWAFNTQEQVEHFKNETINKGEITYSLLYHDDNYELANKFLSWCFGSEEKIHEFKIYFAESKSEIVEIGYKDWHLLEKFVNWCFNTDEEIHNFKSYFSRSYQIWKTVFSCIAFGYRFDFIENVIKWCFNSHEEIKEFKEDLALSEQWMQLLQRFVSNYKNDSDWNTWDLIKKLLKLVSPLDEDVIIKLKERIALDIDFDDFRGDYKESSFRVQKKHLFRLLDKDSYDKKDDYNEESSDSAHSEDEHNVSNFDDESVLVLTEVLNNVESSLQVDNN